MRLGTGAGRHPHQSDDHAVAFDAGAVGGGIIRTAENVVHRGEVEHVFTIPCALGAGRSRNRLRHRRLLFFVSASPHCEIRTRQAMARADALSPAAASKACARVPRMPAWSAAERPRPRTWCTPSGMPMSNG